MSRSRISHAVAPKVPLSVGPYPLIGTCVSHLPELHAVLVLLRSGQVVQARVATRGPNDALRVRHDPLPTAGTDGLLLFPHGDNRNAVWIGSIDRNQQNAYTSAPGSPHDAYEADWSGGWRLRDSNGNYAEQWPDGTSLVVGNGGSVPATYRTTVASGQAPERVQFPFSARVQSAPSPWPVKLMQAAGTTLQVGADGSVTVTVTGGAQLVMQTNGAVTVTAPGTMTVSGDLHVTGAVIAGYGGGDQVGLQTHEHNQPPDSHGDSESATTAPIAGT